MTESTNTSEMTTTPETAQPETRDGTVPVSKHAGNPDLDEFRKLLAGEESGESPVDGEAGESQQNAAPNDGEPPAEKPKGKPKVLKDLAETLGLEDKDLYAIQVPMADGKTMTIGELKDAVAKQDDLSVRELELEERKAKLEAEITRERADLEALVKLIDPKALTPQFVEEVKRRAADEAKREMQATLELIPEWQNADVREKELAGMVEYLKGFGIPPTFLSAAPNHKLFRLVRDAWQRKTRVEAALAKLTPVKRDTTAGKSRPTGSAPRKPTAPAPSLNTGDMRDRFRAILQAEG